MGGGMEANKNRFIEHWSTARENLEYNFRWTRRNLAFIGLFGIAIPIFVYEGIVREFGISDDGSTSGGKASQIKASTGRSFRSMAEENPIGKPEAV